MAKIKIVSSMAFDAICFMEIFTYHETSNLNFLPEQMAFVKKIDELTSGKLKNGCLNMSSLCGQISSYNKNTDFENYTLDDLAEFFQDPKNIRKEATDEWADLTAEWAEKYLDYINVLKEIGFDKLWESDLLPIIQEDIKNKQEVFKSLDIDGTLADMQKLKQCGPLGDVKVYVSIMSFPIAFKLHGNSFLDCIHGNMGAGIICHELMHGFTNKELESVYLEYVNSIKYLTEQHDRLLNEFHSGNEEEFVMAAEYYLRMRHNGENKKDLLKYARDRYNGCVPTSVFLFALLSEEPEVPNGYEQWLTDVFKNKKLPQKAIERHLDEIAPKSPWESFVDKQFGCFRRMLLKVQEIQKDPENKYRSFNAEKEIEKILNKKFEDNTQSVGKSVYFGQERQPLPNAVKVKELQFDNLFINIAEYENMDKALNEWIDDTGANMWGSTWHRTNFSCIGKTPATSSITFVKNNFRISFTAKCPAYVNRNIEYPSNLKEYGDLIRNMQGKSPDEWKKRDKELNITPYEEFAIKYADEILSTQKKIEDVIMQL